MTFELWLGVVFVTTVVGFLIGVVVTKAVTVSIIDHTEAMNDWKYEYMRALATLENTKSKVPKKPAAGGTTAKFVMAVDQKGFWSASGWKDMDRGDAIGNCLCEFESDDYRILDVEVNLDLKELFKSAHVSGVVTGVEESNE